MLGFNPKTAWNNQVKRPTAAMDSKEDEKVDQQSASKETGKDYSATDMQRNEINVRWPSPQFDDYDDPPTCFNNEQLDPDMRTLFEDDQNDHIRWRNEPEAQQRARTEAIGRIPPMPATYYSQDGNTPEVRSGSIGSDVSSGRSSDEQSLRSDESRMDIDAGRFFPNTEPEIANTLASRRRRNTPCPIDSDKDEEEDALAVQNDIETPVNSATFRETLRASVQDLASLEKLEREFDQLNERKNEIAFNLYDSYKETAENNQAIESDRNAARSTGGEQKGIPLEQLHRDSELERKKRERILQMAKNDEDRKARLAAMAGAWPSQSSRLMLPQNDEDFEASIVVMPNEEDDEDDEEEMCMGSRDFFSDDGFDPRDRDDERRQETCYSDGWLGDDGSRLPPLASHMHAKEPAGHDARDSVYSVSNPLPVIPYEETTQTLVSMHILLRLLPIKIALIEQTNAEEPDEQKVDTICERASSVCDFAAEMEASRALQGRCAFYMGLAEYLRSQVESESDKIYAAVITYFENAGSLCDGWYEESVWGEDWARALRREGGGQQKDTVEPEGARTGSGEGLFDGLMNKMWQGTGSFVKNKGAVSASVKKESKKESWSSDSGGRFTPGKGNKFQRPEDVRSEDGEEQVPNNVFGGMVSVADLRKATPKQRKMPVNLGLDTSGQPVQVKNTVFSPANGIFDSPERYVDDFAHPPTKPAINKVMDAEVYTTYSGPSSLTEVSLLKGKGGFRVAGPDPPSTGTIVHGEERSLPAPVTIATSPATPPTGSSVLVNAIRRLSSAISSTSDTSAHSHKLPTAPEDDETDSARVRPLSLAERRKGSVALIRSWTRISPTKPQDSLDKAEKGHSPVTPRFDVQDGIGNGKVAKSPLSPPGSGGSADGLKKRRSGGRISREEVA